MRIFKVYDDDMPQGQELIFGEKQLCEFAENRIKEDNILFSLDNLKEVGYDDIIIEFIMNVITGKEHVTDVDTAKLIVEIGCFYIKECEVE